MTPPAEVRGTHVKATMLPRLLARYEEAIASLDASVGALTAYLQAAKNARPLASEELIGKCALICKAGEAVRKSIGELAATAGEPVPEWTQRTELDLIAARLVSVIEEQAATRWKERLRDVGAKLNQGQVVSHRTHRVITALEELRPRAAAEIERVADGPTRVFLPGTDHGDWLAWIWQQPGEELDALLSPLKAAAPLLCQFLLDVDPADWQVAKAAQGPMGPSTETSVAPTPIPPAAELHPSSLPSASPAQEKAKEVISVEVEAKVSVPETTTAESESSIELPQKVERRSLRPQQKPREDKPTDAESASPAAVPRAQVREPGPAAFEDSQMPALSIELPDSKEIISHCAEGDFLRALLLATGRSFADAPELDPVIEALVIAHYVCQDARTIPWPDWCFDPSASAVVSTTFPESARLVFLAAQCVLADSEGGTTAIPEPVSQTLLATFNELPELRGWLKHYLETVSVPGLWQRLRSVAQSDPVTEYRQRRQQYLERYQRGLLNRNPKAAYIHRQDYFLSRLPVAKVLHDRLKPNRPDPASAEEQKQIAMFVRRRPESITDDWVASVSHATWAVKLRGTQRADLVRRAEDFLDAADGAWQAAISLLRAPPADGEVARRRKQLRDTLPAAVTKAQGRPWLPLLQRLTQGLST